MSSIFDRSSSFIMISVVESARMREVKFNHRLTKCKRVLNLHFDTKIIGKTSGIDVKILSDHNRQDGNAAVGEIGNRAR